MSIPVETIKLELDDKKITKPESDDEKLKQEVEESDEIAKPKLKEDGIDGDMVLSNVDSKVGEGGIERNDGDVGDNCGDKIKITQQEQDKAEENHGKEDEATEICDIEEKIEEDAEQKIASEPETVNIDDTVVILEGSVSASETNNIAVNVTDNNKQNSISTENNQETLKINNRGENDDETSLIENVDKNCDDGHDNDNTVQGVTVENVTEVTDDLTSKKIEGKDDEPSSVKDSSDVVLCLDDSDNAIRDKDDVVDEPLEDMRMADEEEEEEEGGGGDEEDAGPEEEDDFNEDGNEYDQQSPEKLVINISTESEYYEGGPQLIYSEDEDEQMDDEDVDDDDDDDDDDEEDEDEVDEEDDDDDDDPVEIILSDSDDEPAGNSTPHKPRQMEIRPAPAPLFQEQHRNDVLRMRNNRRASRVSKEKYRRSNYWGSYLKRRSVKWLSKRMHVMESDEMVTIVGKNKPSNESDGGAGGGGQSKRAEIKNDVSNKEDEGIEIIEEKDEDDNKQNDIIESSTEQSENNVAVEKTESQKEPQITKEVESVEMGDDEMIIESNDQIPVKKIDEIVDDGEDDDDDDDDEMAVDLSSPHEVNEQKLEEENKMESMAIHQPSKHHHQQPEKKSSSPPQQNLPQQQITSSQTHPSNNNTTTSAAHKVENLSKNVLEPLLRSQSNNNLENKNDENTTTNITNSTNSTTSSTTNNNRMTVGDDGEKEESISDKENIDKEEVKDGASKKIQTQSGAIKRTLSSTSEQSIDYTLPSKKHCDEQDSGGGSAGGGGGNGASGEVGKQMMTKSTSPSPPVTTDNQQANSRSVTPKFDPTVKEFLDKSQNDTPDDIKKHIVRIEDELKTLDEMLRVKEEEWNNMLHLKKVKEEILERLTRKKRIHDIRSILSVDEFQPQYFGTHSTTTASKNTMYDHLKDLQTMMPNVGATAGGSSSTTQSILQLRANMKPADLVKEKLNTQRIQRNILSKNSSSSMSGKPSQQVNPLLYTTTGTTDNHSSNSYYNPVLIPKKPSIHQQQQNEYLNGHHQSMGRQGAIKDVQSIIADFREKHPEQVPRRGRRLRPSFTMNELTGEGGTAGNSRPSSADSSHSNSNSIMTSTPNHPQSNNQPTALGNQSGNQSQNVSFKDVLVKFAKMTPTERQKLNAGNSSSLLASLNLSNTKAVNASYPEVTLHPLSAIHSEQQNIPSGGSTNVGSGPSGSTPGGGGSHTNSLLHGILTKNSNRSTSAYNNSFSPTLARLLTAPERITPQASAAHYSQPQTMTGPSSLHTVNSLSTGVGVNLTKNHNNEITITPVVGGAGHIFMKKDEHHQQQHREANNMREFINPRLKTETYAIDDEADDSADRLVIDEDQGDAQNSATAGQEFHENEVPECQGCKKREAQFVCAGCGNQWYCSRECQVRAWDEHSEVCTG